ncbi:MAG: DNA-processing protein DprA [Anaerovoracaceae bacterium]
MEIRTVNIDDPNYPEILRSIKNPPKRLYYMGNIGLLSTLCVSLVGSRKTSDYGYWVANNVSKRLVDHNVTVVSGMAKGIDTFAHRGTIKNNGKTIAVLGTGIDLVFPSENKALRDEIAKKGLIVSEYPPGYEGNKWTFPARNRIISGLSVATVVCEAGLHSGAMITAEFAESENRLLYAVPGNINNIYNMGNNKLIADGAMPLIVIDDLIADLGINKKIIKEQDVLLGDDEKIIMRELVKCGEITIEQLCTRVKMKPAIVNGIVTILEMKGIANTSLGKVFIAK